jgi:hypothetical protein
MAYEFEPDEFQWGGDSDDSGPTYSGGSSSSGDSTNYAGIIGATLEGAAAIIAAAIGGDVSPAPAPSGAPAYKPPAAKSTGPPAWVWAVGGGAALLLLMRRRR